MPQNYKVSKAFLSTDQNTKEPQVINTAGGEMHKFMVQVENQPVKGWFSILKKVGNKVSVGDELYGDIVENNYGKPQFNRSQKPYNQQVPQTSSAVTLEVVYNELKLVRGLLENQFRSSGQQPTNTKSVDTDTQNADDKPADLSQFDY